MSEQSFIEVYPVGMWHDWKLRKLGKMTSGAKYLRAQIGKRNWRAVRNYFNGYLAEWHYCPEGVNHTKCGRGWTKRAALRSLGVHIAESNTKGGAR